MRIGYLVPEFPGQTHAFFWRELNAIEEAGAEISLFSTRRPPQDACPHVFREAAISRTTYLFPPRSGAALTCLSTRPAAAMAAVAYVAGLSETPIGQRARLMALLLSAADLADACKTRGIDHVHIHSCANAAHLGALSRILGGPSYSLTLHGDLPVYGTDHQSKFCQAAFVSAVTRPLSDSVRALVPDIDAPVIWMGVDTDRFHPADHPRPARTKAGPFTVVTVARLNHTKGHRYLLEAMASLVAEGMDLRYQIVGDGPEREAIIAEIARLGLGDRVTMRGALSEEGVLDQLHGADALALTSFGQGEAAPVTVMEAMAAGLPVICSRIGGTPDMIADGKDGLLVEQKDPASIAEALRRLVTEPGFAERLGAAARLTAIEKFDYRSNALKLLSSFRRISP